MEKIKFRKLFKIMRDEDEGCAIYSIVKFRRLPYLWTNFPVGDFIKGESKSEVVVIQYKCYLEIDLWILILNFQWLQWTLK